MMTVVAVPVDTLFEVETLVGGSWVAGVLFRTQDEAEWFVDVKATAQYPMKVVCRDLCALDEAATLDGGAAATMAGMAARIDDCVRQAVAG